MALQVREILEKHLMYSPNKVQVIYMKHFLILFLILICTISHADIFTNASVPSTSLGNCFYPGDISSVLYNPAGLAYSAGTHFLGSHYALFDNARFNFLGYSQQFDNFNIGLSFLNLYRGNIEVRTDNMSDPSEYTSSNKLAIVLTGSTILPYQIVAGCSIKTVNYTIYYTQSNYGLGIDIGILKEIINSGEKLNYGFNLTAGLSLLNLLGPVIKTGDSTDKYPAGLRISIIPSITLFPKYNLKEEKITYDKLSLFTDIYYSDFKYTLIGLEYSYRNKINLRAGTNSQGITAGFGLNFTSLQLNYSILPKDYTILHFIDVVYNLSTPKDKTPKELTDYMKTYKKAERLYDKQLRYANELIKDTKYEPAKEILIKIIPIFPEKPRAKELLTVCENSARADKLNILNTEYQNAILQISYVKAYKCFLSALDTAPDDVLVQNILNDLKSKTVSDENKQTLNQEYIKTVNDKIKTFVSNQDFDKAYIELKKLNLLEPDSENTYSQRKYIDNELITCVTDLLQSATKYQREKDYKSAYPLIKEAYRLNKDEPTKYQLEQIKTEYNKEKGDTPLTEELYQKKLFYLSAMSFALDEPDKAKETFYELKNRNITYDFDELEKAMR